MNTISIRKRVVQKYLLIFNFLFIPATPGFCIFDILMLPLMEKPDSHSLKNLIVVGDRVLIKPKSISNKSKGGLFLPPGYQEKEEIQTGYIVKCGPGYPIPIPSDESEEVWKKTTDPIKYIPLQAKAGDMAIFLQKGAIEIIFNEEKYFIVSQNSILLLERDEDLFG